MSNELRDELARAVTAHILWRDQMCMCGQPWGPLHVSRNLLPIIDRHIAQARVEGQLELARVARAEMAEQISAAIRDLDHGYTQGTAWVPDFDAGWRHGRMDCLAVVQTTARQHTGEVSDDE